MRYGELALKSPPVRREFEGALRRNLLDQFVTAGMACRVRSDRGHLYVEVENAEAAARLVRRVFGVTSLSQVREVASELVSMRAAMLEMAEPMLAPGASFAVRARRTGQHAFTSQTLGADLGAAILDRWPERGLHVDLDSPMVELHVEVRGPKAYLSTGRWRGPGGLPLGVAGRVVALVDGRRGALGAYLMMKRGCKCAFAVLEGASDLVEDVLLRFDPKALREAAQAPGPAAWPMVAELAETTRADGLVLPLTVEEFPEARSTWGDRVVFSPTVAWSDTEVDERWNRVRELIA